MSPLPFLILLFPFVATGNSPEKHHRLIIPVVKDPDLGLHYAVVGFGTNPTVLAKFGLEFGGRFSWYICSDPGYNSSSYRPIRFSSPKCKLANQASLWDCGEAAEVMPRCLSDSCGVNVYRPNVRGSLRGGLAQDVMSFISTPDGLRLGPRVNSPPLIFACTESDAIYGLPYSALGMFGLSRNTLSFPTQISSAFNIRRKFSLCLPSKPQESNQGKFLIGGGPYLYPPFKGDVSRLFATTSLVTNPVNRAEPPIKGAPSDEYFIDVKSIEIDGEPIPLKKSLLSIDKKGNGGIKIGPEIYTFMHSYIYKPFRKAFVAKAKKRGIVNVSSDRSQFDMCFDRKSIGTAITGPDMPVIELVLKTGRWRFYGSNLMRDADENTTCLPFIDAGGDFGNGVLLGWHLLEDTLMEFDLESSNFSVTSSLLLHNTSCSRS
ncbi:PREDICTED: uncharacterized protein LOC104820107 [Tarenaya hassleriana]|uniref:uncharacterized protein LOC104820107 n=1 Tax=Tarenaya hassleriana TaxID=28532 RepID=UPI00053C60A1|nr:PREDICTED: uncharacterized protein LOC104820107 [Tarenaya hassleriana]